METDSLGHMKRSVKFFKISSIFVTLFIAWLANTEYCKMTSTSVLIDWTTRAHNNEDISIRILRPGYPDVLLSSLQSAHAISINNQQTTRLIEFLDQACHYGCSESSANVVIEIFNQTEKERLEISDSMLKQDIRIKNFLTLASLIARGEHVVNDKTAEIIDEK